MTKRNYIFFLFFLLTSSNFFAQNVLSGTVLDERSIPIPFSQVYVKNSADLRTVTDVNGYYEMRLFSQDVRHIFYAMLTTSCLYLPFYENNP